MVSNGANNNTIGGYYSAGLANMMSGNTGHGVHLVDASTRENTVTGNVVGTKLSGEEALGNGGYGIFDESALSNDIGLDQPGFGNVVSANDNAGIVVFGADSAGTSIQGNVIGTSLSRILDLGNGGSGIEFQGGVTGIVVGGELLAGANIIRYNQGAGVNIGSSAGNRLIAVLINRISNNAGLGIELGGTGVELNDPDDVDTGSNDLQNTARLTRVETLANGTTVVEGIVDSLPNTDFRLDLYSSVQQDVSGSGEAETFLGTLSVSTDASGDAIINDNLPVQLTHGHFVSSTLTSLNGAGDPQNTSEFSVNTPAVVRDNDPVITSDGAGASASLIVDENQVGVTTVEATDADVGTTFSYSLSGGTDQLAFGLASSYGVLTFNAAPDHEAKKAYQVEVTVTDDTGRTDTQLLNITVADVNEPPIITSDGGASTVTVSVDENQSAVTRIEAADEDDGAVVLYSISGGADQASFSIDYSTGELTFVASPDHEMQESYTVEISATSEGMLTDTQLMTVSVNDVNEAPVTRTDELQITENQSIAIDVQENLVKNDIDPEGDPLEIVGFTQPENGTLIRNDRGELLYTPHEEFAGLDRFHYQVRDTGGNVASGLVLVSVPRVEQSIVDSSGTVDESLSAALPVTESTRLPSEVQDEYKPPASRLPLQALRVKVKPQPLEDSDKAPPLEETQADSDPVALVRVVAFHNTNQQDSSSESDSASEQKSQTALGLVLRISSGKSSLNTADIQYDPFDIEPLDGMLPQELHTLIRSVIQQDMDTAASREMTITLATLGIGSSLVAGVTIWTIRSGALLALAATTLPLWRPLDIVPILPSRSDDD